MTDLCRHERLDQRGARGQPGSGPGHRIMRATTWASSTRRTQALDPRGPQPIRSFFATWSPRHPALSEEGNTCLSRTARNGTSSIVDPVDGTKTIKRNGEFTVNIALVGMAVPWGGFAPVLGHAWGVVGEGAWRLDVSADVDAGGQRRVPAPLETCIHGGQPLTHVARNACMWKRPSRFTAK